MGECKKRSTADVVLTRIYFARIRIVNTTKKRSDKMEAMGIMGFIFGMAGLSLAMTARHELTSLKKAFDDLKKNLGDAGILKDPAGPEDQ